MNQPLPDFLSEAAELESELTSLREAFHRTPELGNHEFKTAERIEHTLRALGLRPRRVLDTGVVATLHGSRPGPTIALRADMDALPVQETTGAPFASEIPGVMHACGHDVHITSALGAAMLLSRHRDSLCGSVRFVFQPDEEGEGGAERMIASGCMKGVAATFGGHVTPDLPAGTVGVRYGKFYAASDTFQIRLYGRAAHGAEREKGIDALEAGALLVQELIRLPERLTGERSVVSVGTFRAGTARNIVADEAVITGIMRTLGDEARI
ncbi:MAG: amidohydrolase, partial [Oscillospiraceae bacterium]|nr:amidohydrolase [Oscillospiraceae bacterium]